MFRVTSLLVLVLLTLLVLSPVQTTWADEDQDTAPLVTDSHRWDDIEYDKNSDLWRPPVSLHIACDSSNKPGVVSLDSAGRLSYRWRDGSREWHTEEVDDGLTWDAQEWDCFLWYGRLDEPNILVLGVSAKEYVTTVVRYRQGPGEKKFVSEVVSHSPYAAIYPRLSVASDGSVYVAFPVAYVGGATGRPVRGAAFARLSEEWTERRYENVAWCDIAVLPDDGVYVFALVKDPRGYEAGRLTADLSLGGLERVRGLERIGAFHVLRPGKALWDVDVSRAATVRVYSVEDDHWTEADIQIHSPYQTASDMSFDVQVSADGEDGWALLDSRGYVEKESEVKDPWCILYAQGRGAHVDNVYVVARQFGRVLAAVSDAHGDYHIAFLDDSDPMSLEYRQFHPPRLPPLQATRAEE